MRNRKKRRPDFRRIRPSKTYTLPEIAATLDRNPDTVRRWIRDGLPTLDGGRPALVLGSVLKEWLSERWRANKRKCGPDELFCFRCQAPRRPRPGSACVIFQNVKTVMIHGFCEQCGTRMRKAGSKRKLAEIDAALGAPAPPLQHLDRYDDPSVKRTCGRLDSWSSNAQAVGGQIPREDCPGPGGKLSYHKRQQKRS